MQTSHLEEFQEIEADVKLMRTARSKQHFLKLAAIFVDKYEEKLPEFTSYFQSEWVQAHPNWFLGTSHFSPGTNNGIESFNGRLKTNHTMRKLLPLKTFCLKLFEWVKTWSLKYENNEKVFHKVVPITKELWVSGKEFALLDKTIKAHKKDDNSITYIVPSGTKTSITTLDRSTFDTLEQYRDNCFEYYLVTMPNSNSKDSDSYLRGVCDCPQFYKHYMCKHILGVALRLKLVKVPLSACNTKLPVKMGPGRPGKAKKALQKQ